MARIIFLNRFYWPETPATGQLLTDLAEALTQQGRSVMVITSRAASSASPARERREGVDIVRIRTPRAAQPSVAGKALAFAAFWIGGTWRLFRETKRGDIVVALTDPPLIGVAAWIVASLRGARLVHWVQDIYPEVAVAVTGHRWLRIVRPVRNGAWRAADVCVVLSHEMTAIVAKSGTRAERIVAIPNWAPAGLVPLSPTDSVVTHLRNEWDLKGKFIVAYSGNLGRVHDLDPIIEAAALLVNKPQIVFVLIGGGAQRDAVAREVERRSLPNVRFIPAQPRNLLNASLAVADLHLVTLRPGCEPFVFPSKLYGVTAAGRPVLFVGPPDCELARLVRTNELGRVVDRDNPMAIAQTVQELYHSADVLAQYARAAAVFGGIEHTERAMAQWRDQLDGLARVARESMTVSPP